MSVEEELRMSDEDFFEGVANGDLIYEEYDQDNIDPDEYYNGYEIDFNDTYDAGEEFELLSEADFFNVDIPLN